jgi:serine/threonine-protein kinase
VDEASLIGSTLGDRYRLLAVIGEGGIGRVFRAERLATGQTVALKLLHPEFSGVNQVVQRFEREAEVTTRLAHPHIVQVVEFGELNGQLFIAMELLAGRSLGDLIGRDGGSGGHRLSVARTIGIMHPVLDALEYAHARAVVHRDLKPENIMVTPARGLFSRESVKLLDFGIAKLGPDTEGAAQKLTQLGLVLGTPAYMSPEQAAGQQADLRSDIYSCGVILYEMLTGRRPFEADSSVEVLSMHVTAAPKPLRAVAADARIPAALDDVVLRALAKRPADRFQSARELRQALARAARARRGEAAVSGIETTMLAPSAAPQPRRRWLHLAIIAVAAAVLVGDHLRPRAPTIARPIPTSDAAGAGRKTPRDPASRRSLNQARASAKKPPLRNR